MPRAKKVDATETQPSIEERVQQEKDRLSEIESKLTEGQRSAQRLQNSINALASSRERCLGRLEILLEIEGGKGEK